MDDGRYVFDCHITIPEEIVRVVENIARKFGASKSDLLDREADYLAVRIALSETQVIPETKKALAKSGVNIASLEEYAAGKTDGMKRSNHVILVKNLPYGSSEGELASMFGKFGSLDKIILPPTKTLALLDITRSSAVPVINNNQVVFLEPAEACAAFWGLAYKRYKSEHVLDFCFLSLTSVLEMDLLEFYCHWDTPLYLEWAPGNILEQTNHSKNALIVEDDAKRVLLEQQVEVVTDPDVDPDRVEDSLRFVMLLFKSPAVVERVMEITSLKNVDLDRMMHGNQQLVKLLPCDQEVKGSSRGNRLWQKCKIKSLRLPMRFGNHRGFAFVEFVTKQEAKNAIEALSNTHLYGRHLVLERHKEGDSLEELRARAAAQFSTEQNGFKTSKLSKKRKQMAILDEGCFKFERIAD
ncbi:hypothetical protein RND71_002079 [Anisodus tanguticus]|uniref:RRM domain-containing protein n=1 Tax=Anisodus tanguticus TaxID=243964 RepID=A0AAE1T1Z5_9SOLA|nr:hypothetical protein RND71_002079 [Anisodus tanguticus]